ncbi:uncharacterized protein LOC134753847 [Cydia strobilella]|uniref:uncharacterized protein LOC134753847 n=1 Tax=Cydia strobilella TaxID=1100964 RepID=UPI003005A8ED
MLSILIISALFSAAKCASYQRDDSSYSTYSTASNLYDEYGQRNLNLGDDIAGVPGGTRYPNSYLDSSSSGYNGVLQGPNNHLYPGYSTPRYAPGYDNYGQSYGQNYGPSYGQNYGQNYGQGYGQSYGQQGFSSYEFPFVRNNRDYCINRAPQTGIWVERLMGMWYGVELVQHLAGDTRVDYGRTCIVIHISEPKDRIHSHRQLHHVEALNAQFRQMYRHLRLVWDEEGQTVEYALYFNNNSAGYWQAFGGQNGSLSQRSTYRQFTGTVQVLKAVNDHLVLNFCQEGTNGQSAELYSVLFTRDPLSMTRWEVESVHSLLQNKNLSVASRRMVCGNGAEAPAYSVLLSFFTCLFAYIVCSS